MTSSIFLSFHIIFAVAIVILVLVQHGKGADMGAAFGSGSAGSLFGSSGAGTFLSKATATLAALFFVTSLLLTYFQSARSGSGVMGSVISEAAKEAAKDANKDATKDAAKDAKVIDKSVPSISVTPARTTAPLSVSSTPPVSVTPATVAPATPVPAPAAPVPAK